jgi:hypothetical protein
MHLLQAGVDMVVIALWLGHESIETTYIYVEVDFTIKERISAFFDAIFHWGIDLFLAARLRRRFDVLVQMENVIRVVLPFDLD